MSRLRPLVHLAALAALAAFAFALGRYLSDPTGWADLALLIVVALAVGWCIARLYRPGGLASFSSALPRERAAADERKPPPERAPERRPVPPGRRPGVGMPFADDPGDEPPRRLWSR